MSVLRVAITGASGRMGQELIKLIEDKPNDFQMVAGLSRSASFHAVSRLEDLTKHPVDLVVDFSSPDYFAEVLKWCLQKKTRLVSGTTGLSPELFAEMKSASATIPILYAANMSLGVAVVNEMIKVLRLIDSYDFAIEELHHRHKKDAPSGTALHLKATLEKAIGKPAAEACVRGGGIFGVHRILAMGPEETITVEHNALNRSVFASGALKAAKWLATQQPGLYSIADVLNLKEWNSANTPV